MPCGVILVILLSVSGWLTHNFSHDRFQTTSSAFTTNGDDSNLMNTDLMPKWIDIMDESNKYVKGTEWKRRCDECKVVEKLCKYWG